MADSAASLMSEPKVWLVPTLTVTQTEIRMGFDSHKSGPKQLQPIINEFHHLITFNLCSLQVHFLSSGLKLKCDLMKDVGVFMRTLVLNRVEKSRSGYVIQNALKDPF